jgi:exopolyphosphatase/guanosine-5'-triphosphate,3'-diphosphate pyrophosphatase
MKKRRLNENHLGLILADFSPAIAKFLNRQLKGEHLDLAIGTGGNIECLGRLKTQLLRKSPDTVLSFRDVHQIIGQLRGLSIEDRIKQLNLRPDRADVILPASAALQNIVNLAGIDRIMVPYVGLRDGLLWFTFYNGRKNA